MASTARQQEEIDLGSLLRPGARAASGPTCTVCASPRITRIALELEDGSAVEFTNCLDCEHRVWQRGDEVLSVEHVLDSARRAK